MKRLLKRLAHAVTGHEDDHLDRAREYLVWDGHFETGTSSYRMPVKDHWHIRCSCGKCLRHCFDETETTIEAESLPEVWAKIGGGPTELMDTLGYPDVYPPRAAGIVKGMKISMDKLDKLGIELPSELEN